METSLKRFAQAACLALGLSASLWAGPVSPPAGNYITKTGPITISTDTTWTGDFFIPSSSLITINNSVTLTINGTVHAGIYKIFNCLGTGKVVFNAHLQREGYPEWWGAQTNNGSLDNVPFLNAAVVALPIVKLQEGIYYTTETWKINTNSVVIEGSYLTYIYCTTGTVDIVQVGPDSDPGSINNFLFGVMLSRFNVARPVPPTPTGQQNAPAGIRLQYVRNSNFEDLNAYDSSIGFSYSQLVSCHFTRLFATRGENGTTHVNDSFLAHALWGLPPYYLESLYWTDCSASIAGGLTLTQSIGFYVNGAFTDNYFLRPEADGMTVGFFVDNGTSTALSIDNQINGGVFDQEQFAGVEIANVPTQSAINISNTYTVLANTPTATAGFYIHGSSAQVSIVNSQSIGTDGTGALGLYITNSSNVSSRNNMWDEMTRPVALVNSTNCTVEDSIYNKAVTTTEGAIDVIDSTQNVIRPMIRGDTANVYPDAGVRIVGTDSAYNEINVSGIDTFGISAGSGKVTYNGVVISTAGEFGVGNQITGVLMASETVKFNAFNGDGSGLTHLTAANIDAGSLGTNVIASSLAVNSVYPSAVLAGTYSNITLPAANVASGNLGSSVIASSIAVGSVGPAQTTGLPLLASTQTWTGQQVWASPQPSTFTYGVSVGSLTTGGKVSANNFDSTGSTPPNNGFTQSAANVLSLYSGGVLGLQVDASHNVQIPNNSTVTYNLSVGSGTVRGWEDFNAQASNPTSPPAGVARFHSATTQGFTRFEQDNEAATNLILGRDNVFIAKNTSGGSIAAGQVVYVTGSTGNVPNVSLAISSTTTRLPAVGVALDAIGSNNFGQIMVVGIVSNINTSAFSSGDTIFVSTSTAGTFTNIRPIYPNSVQRIGSVLVSGTGNGSVYVDIAPFTGMRETGSTSDTFTLGSSTNTTIQFDAVGTSTFTYAVKASSFIGNGANLTAIPAAQISAGSLGSSVIASSITLAAMYGAPSLTGTNFTSLPGAQVGSGVPAANIATGSLGASVICSSNAVNSVGSAQLIGPISISTLTVTSSATVSAPLNLSGNLKFNATSTQGIVGTATNDSAAAGNVGEYLSAGAAGSNAPTSNQYGDLASISLTAGDWDISGIVFWISSGATWSNPQAGITTHSGNDSTGLVLGDTWITAQFANSSATPLQVTLSIPSARFSLSGSSTVYLKYLAVYTGGPPTAYGRISARRVR